MQKSRREITSSFISLDMDRGYSTAGYCSNMNDSIEALRPIDCTEGNGSHIPDISDREINIILQNISLAKGHHITFLLDCSHAGTDTGAPEQGVRTLPPLSNGSPKQMFDVADENSRQFPSYQSVCSETWSPDMSSHVVLAACQEHQVVVETRKEDGVQSVFTELLIRVLTSGTFSERSSYIDLLFALPTMHGQTPVVAGKTQECTDMVSGPVIIFLCSQTMQDGDRKIPQVME